MFSLVKFIFVRFTNPYIKVPIRNITGDISFFVCVNHRFSSLFFTVPFLYTSNLVWMSSISHHTALPFTFSQLGLNVTRERELGRSEIKKKIMIYSFYWCQYLHVFLFTIKDPKCSTWSIKLLNLSHLSPKKVFE